MSVCVYNVCMCIACVYNDKLKGKVYWNHRWSEQQAMFGSGIKDIEGRIWVAEEELIWRHCFI